MTTHTERVVTNLTGGTYTACISLPFGDGQSCSNGAAKQRIFGYHVDSEFGLAHSHSRYDNLSTGRFMMPDPGNAGADAGNPQSWNAYAYVLNNPLTNTDPSGRDIYACLPGGEIRGCLDFANQSALESDLAGTGAWLQSGQIVVSLNGQTVIAGSYRDLPGPYDEAGGLQSDMLANGLIGGVAAAGVDAVAGLAGLAETAVPEAATGTAEGIAASAAGSTTEATVQEVVQRASSAVGNEGVTVANEQVAQQAADEFLGPGSRELR